ncbi:uncharacterized protein MONOS_14934 [Monocercomonoides exilis]|uniref:uncharacterized protein n=1 Tax=Monocercomonoides exilis TaxID=2049356 RepID=UPI00355A06E3|nr:hypothetical protein MONOS_14934 [Monocercomonoides exilis]
MQKTTNIDSTKKFTELFSRLSSNSADKQKRTIEEINEMIIEMNEKDSNLIFTKELFDKMDKMIEEKEICLENAFVLLKSIGCWNVLKNVHDYSFRGSSLNQRFKKMIIEEELKKEEKNEKLLVDLFECFILLNFCFPLNSLSICVPCLLKSSSNKEENKEAQTEVEVALLALSGAGYCKLDKELFLDEIKEIIEYHQEHHNLTRIAYQSAWMFLIKRIIFENSLEEIIVNELHFAREARRELEELSKCVDGKRKEGWKGGKETKEELLLMKWIETLLVYFRHCKLWNEDFADLINSLVQVFRIAKDNHREISGECINVLEEAARNRSVTVDDLLRSGAVDVFLEEIHKSTMNDRITIKSLEFIYNISNRLKKEDDERKEAKRKITKRNIYEKMEEEGYEDTIFCFKRMLYFLCMNYEHRMACNVSYYFVNV